MAAASSSCDGSRAIVVLSVGSRPFVGITRPLLDAYARRVSAALHIVSSAEHEALAPWRERLRATPRFLKLPLLDYHLRRYARVMLLDDDVLISPHAGDLFGLTPCERIGAVSSQRSNGRHPAHLEAFCKLALSGSGSRASMPPNSHRPSSLYSQLCFHPASCRRWKYRSQLGGTRSILRRPATSTRSRHATHKRIGASSTRE